jgi:hypothetical protein
MLPRSRNRDEIGVEPAARAVGTQVTDGVFDTIGSRRRELLLGMAHIPRLAVIVTGLLGLFAPGTASAADKVVLGGGAAIVVNGEDACTLTAIGNDNQGNLVGFTSAHCGGPGAQVAAEGTPAAGTLGVMVAGNDALDYAVIKFDPAKVTPVNNYNGFQIDGVGPDPTFGQIACKLGRTTGYSCGVTWGPGEKPGTILSQVCGRPGDSGAPVTVNNVLVGMIHGAFSEDLPTCVVKYIPLHTPAVAESMTSVLADLNAKGRPGAGFVPVT